MRMGVITVGAVLIWLPRMCEAQDRTATCVTCHPEQKEQLGASVHQGLGCRECHGGEKSYAVPPGELEKFMPRRRGPVPGRRPQPGVPAFDHGPSFAGKPGRKEVTLLCGDCHADVERMNPYGLRTDQLARYKTSGHGKALFERQDERVATCTDCHGSPHSVLSSNDPHSRTHPLNVPATCALCHENAVLMEPYDLPTEVVSEYRQSVHGRLLLEQKDTGAPTCATCHGNHSAAPPGFATVGAVCGRCHQQDAKYFSESAHAAHAEHMGCVQCHGGGAGRHFHRIERITRPPGMMIRRYVRLLASEADPTPEQITETIHPAPANIIRQALPLCMECHDDLEEDESLPKLFALLDEIAEAERYYVKTGARLDEVGKGVLLVENQRFKFEDAKTHLIELSPLQHTLDGARVRERIAELTAICDEVNAELEGLVGGLRLRYRLLMPVWLFALSFSALCYVKYKKLRAQYVAPAEAVTAAAAPSDTGAEPGPTRRAFLDWALGAWTAVAGAAVAVPGLLYLWPAARGGKSASVEVEGAADLLPEQSLMVQVAGKVVIVVRGRTGYRAFSAVCTHLGCLVKWEGGGRQFTCPCHAAVFDEDGQVVSGPPPAPLPEYTVKEVGDKVFVTL